MLQSSAYRTNRCPRRVNSRSSSSSTRLDSKGESGPPCGVPSTLGLTSPRNVRTASSTLACVPHHPGRQERPDEFQQPLVFHPLSDLPHGTCVPHQLVVIDPVEKFLQIQIHHTERAYRILATFGDILLRLGHRLLSRPPGSKTVAAVRERRVPLPLQNLHHRLLDEAIQYGWDGQRELHLSTVRIWDGLRSVTHTTRFGASASKYSRKGA